MSAIRSVKLVFPEWGLCDRADFRASAGIWVRFGAKPEATALEIELPLSAPKAGLSREREFAHFDSLFGA
jgi:hypothetical protein